MNDCWVLTPAHHFQNTTEERAVELISMSPGYEKYVFFYAELAVPDDSVLSLPPEE